MLLGGRKLSMETHAIYLLYGLGMAEYCIEVGSGEGGGGFTRENSYSVHFASKKMVDSYSTHT